MTRSRSNQGQGYSSNDKLLETYHMSYYKPSSSAEQGSGCVSVLMNDKVVSIVVSSGGLHRLGCTASDEVSFHV
ncbi:hypothetical protein Lal_00040760 [Lupinus albus]|nr:hypothetical protein Lal_00040760 [Lupinus albus]